MSIARKSATDFLSRIGILVITTLTGILLNRLVGAAGRGAYVLATVVAFTQLQNFASLGIQVSNQVLVGREKNLLGRLHSWTVALSVVVECVFVLGAWLCRGWLVEGVFRGIRPLHLTLVALATGPAFYWMAWQGLMIGLGDIKGMARLNFYLAFVQNAAIVIILSFLNPLHHPERLNFVIDLLVLVFVGITIVSVIPMTLLLRRHGCLIGALEAPLLGRLVSFGSRVYVGNVASGLLNQLDQLLVNGLAGLSHLGVYNQAASLANKVWMVSAGIEGAAYTPMTSATRDEARALTVNLFRITFLISIGLILVGWIASPLIPLIYGNDFINTVYPFRLLILGTAVFGCGRMFSMYFTGYKKSPQTLLILNWILLPIHANLCLWLIPSYGLKGACLATTLTYSFSMMTLLVLFWRDGPSPGLRRLFIPQVEDLERLKGFLRRRRNEG